MNYQYMGVLYDRQACPALLTGLYNSSAFYTLMDGAERRKTKLFRPFSYILCMSTTWLCAGRFFIWKSSFLLFSQNSWRSSFVVNMIILTCLFLMQIPQTMIAMSARIDTMHTKVIKTAW